MKNKSFILIFILLIISSCTKDKEILSSLNDYNISMESQGYHFGNKIKLPKAIVENVENISISFGDKETKSLIIDANFFTLGKNAVTFIIQKKNGEVLYQDATIVVFARKPESELSYNLVNEYPHNTKNFTEGFYLEGNVVYESIGQERESKLMKYTLGGINVIKESKQSDNIFSEGISSIGDRIYQLTYKNKIGFVYDKDSFKLLEEFNYPSVISEGWGMTTDGKYLIVSDGSKNIYFLNPKKPSEVIRYISVAGNKEIFDKLNELEYHKGFIYANVWQTPIILKINPANGEVEGKFDFSEIVKQNTVGNEDVLNGIAFKGDNMVVTGKNWNKIYELQIIE